jgi:hypothetical protein
MMAGCATTPEQQQRQAEKEASVEAILTEASEFSETQRCLRPNEFRDIRILDDQHILFVGRRGKVWLNTLPMRCPGLRRGSTLGIERLSGISSFCRLDSFAVYDWVDWPWYRRWPWDWGGGPRCALGDFQPVNEVQVNALKEALKVR